MNITLSVVVAAIVILITALVIITIFGQSIGNVATIAEGETYCRTVLEASCKTANSKPTVWKVNIGGNVQECSGLPGISSCTCSEYTVSC